MSLIKSEIFPGKKKLYKLGNSVEVARKRTGLVPLLARREMNRNLYCQVRICVFLETGRQTNKI